MTIKPLTQKGFAAVEALLIFVVIAIVGGTGFYVYNANKDTDDTLNDAAKASQSSPNPVSNKNKATPASSQKHLLIKEWGVKIELSDASGDVYYKQRADLPTNLDVYSAKADSITGPNGVSCKGEYIAYLMRLPKSDPSWSEPLTSGYYAQYKDIGEYRYGIATKKTYGPECWAISADRNQDYVVDEATAQKFDAVVKAFRSDFKTLTTAN